MCLWFVLRKTAWYWKGTLLQFVFTSKFKEAVSCFSLVSFQSLGHIELVPVLHLKWGVTEGKWLGYPQRSVMVPRLTLLSSLDPVFSPTQPRLQGAKSSALTQLLWLFLHNMPFKHLTSLWFNTIQGGSRCLSDTIPCLYKSRARNHPYLSVKAVPSIVLTLVCFFWTLHTAKISWLLSNIVNGLS